MTSDHSLYLQLDHPWLFNSSISISVWKPTLQNLTFTLSKVKLGDCHWTLAGLNTMIKQADLSEMFLTVQSAKTDEKFPFNNMITVKLYNSSIKHLEATDVVLNVSGVHMSNMVSPFEAIFQVNKSQILFWKCKFVNISNGKNQNTTLRVLTAESSYVLTTNCNFTNIGGIFIQSSEICLLNDTFISNQGDSIAALYVGSSTATISGSLFVSNHAKLGTTGVYNSTVNLNNSTFTRNIADSGSAVNVQDNSTLVVKNCLFSGNLAGEGSAIYAALNTLVNISNSKFEKNTALSRGTIWMALRGILVVENCTFISNMAMEGGAILLSDGALRNPGKVL